MTMGIWRWADRLPPLDPGARITLGEGETPLVRSRRIGPSAGLGNLHFKLESTNPTGSYKDRYAAVAISHMVANHQGRCIATSSGNTGSALAAYCAAAGIACRIAILETTPEGKLKQMQAHGAGLVRVRGFGTDADTTRRVFEHLKSTAAEPDAALQISAFAYCPVGMAGVHTIAWELLEQAPGPIDQVYCPAGGGGLTLGVARGFQMALDRKELPSAVQVHCVQPEGNDTIATPLRDGLTKARAVKCTTRISGLQVANVIDGHDVIDACRASGGTGHVVKDEQVWATQVRLAREEGIFCEPAGAVATAAAIEAARNGRIRPDASIVCLITGSGFKDPQSVDRMLEGVECPTVSLEELAP